MADRLADRAGVRRPPPRRARIDWAGNVTFAAGAGLLLVAITYGIQPYGGHPTGWTGPFVLGGLAGGAALLAGPVSGYLSDRFGQRLFATAGLLLTAAAFGGLPLLPVDFPYWAFAVLIFCNGIGSGLFASPNTSAIMSSVPARHRGAASGMRATFQNSGVSLSIGIFFSLMIAGLASGLPRTLAGGLRAQGVPAQLAAHVAGLPPVSTLFASFLGYNPVRNLLRPSGELSRLPRGSAAVLTGKQFFPHLISGPFHHGLVIVFTAAIGMSVLGALVSLARGRQFYFDRPAAAAPRPEPGRSGARAGRPARRRPRRCCRTPSTAPPIRSR